MRETASDIKIPVLIVDDEPQILNILSKMIGRHGGFEVTASVSDFAGAIAAFSAHRPEVVFMDIDLADGISDSGGVQGRSGLACAKIMTEIDPQVKIIFATAHSEYMANAFEIYAFDYLVKPFDMQRLNRTLDRLYTAAEAKTTGEYPKTPAADADPAAAESRGEEGENRKSADKPLREEENRESTDNPRRLIVKGREKTWFIDQNDIILIEHRGGSSVIITDSREYETSLSLGSLEDMLDPGRFFRCHKSYIINIGRITSAEVYGRWTYTVHLKGTDTTALMTSQNYDLLRKRLGF